MTRRTVGVRVRVLATVLGLAAVAMTLAGTIVLVVERGQFRDQVDRTITADVAEFRNLADPSRAHSTEPVPADVVALLRTALQRQVPAQDEILLGMLDRKLDLVPGWEQPVALAQLSPVVEAVSRLPADAPVRIREIDTAVGPVRFAAVQARVGADPRLGTYVVGYAMRRGEQALVSNTQLYAVVSGASLTLVALVGWLVAGRLLRPLRLLRDAAEHISHTDLSLRIPVTGQDDVSELTRTVNEMLDRLQAAFVTQQQFLDDAGHELRTPLTIVRGHLEVLDAADPGEVSDVRALVLDELDRMARLVDDLVLLARSRRPDFVRRAPIDLDRLVDDVSDKAAALGPRRWVVDARPGRAVSGDSQRLTQALLQLAQNAVQHTDPGAEIGIGAAVDPVGGFAEQARLWVRDAGVGVRPEDAGRIFERFGRATWGRGHEGSGLGLAIVSAIASAHGGRILLESTPGEGSTFTIVLPATASDPVAPPAPSPALPTWQEAL